jgi:hypothetical protein
MRVPIKLRHLPGRLATGAVIVNAGLSKRRADEATVAGLHGMAAGTYPFLNQIPPRRFVQLLSATEVTLGTALLLPIVPTALVGAGLTAFSAGPIG